LKGVRIKKFFKGLEKLLSKDFGARALWAGKSTKSCSPGGGKNLRRARVRWGTAAEYAKVKKNSKENKKTVKTGAV